jgi:hypothetical protein
MSTDTTINKEPDDTMIGEWLDMGPPSEPPNLGRIAHEAIVDAMVEWFFNNFEDPVHHTPYDGGYVWIWGGPYDARDELETALVARSASLTLLSRASRKTDFRNGRHHLPDCSRKPTNPKKPLDVAATSNPTRSAQGRNHRARYRDARQRPAR